MDTDRIAKSVDAASKGFAKMTASVSGMQNSMEKLSNQLQRHFLRMKFLGCEGRESKTIFDNERGPLVQSECEKVRIWSHSRLSRTPKVLLETPRRDYMVPLADLGVEPGVTSITCITKRESTELMGSVLQRVFGVRDVEQALALSEMGGGSEDLMVWSS